MATRHRLFAASLLALAGCATSPTPNADSLPIPPERVFKIDLTQPREGSVPLIVKRDRLPGGPWCRFHVFVDGTLAAEIDGGEIVTFYVAPGRHIISAATKTNICAAGNSEHQLDVQATKNPTMRISQDVNGSMRLAPTAF